MTATQTNARTRQGAAAAKVSPDRIFIQQVLAGNEEAFTHLINKYKDQLFELACRILKNRSEAEDILQDAFLQAYRHLGDFRHDSQFSTWLYSIVLNRVRNRMRQNKVLHWYSLDVRRADREDVRVPELPHKGPSLDLCDREKDGVRAYPTSRRPRSRSITSRFSSCTTSTICSSKKWRTAWDDR